MTQHGDFGVSLNNKNNKQNLFKDSYTAILPVNATILQAIVERWRYFFKIKTSLLQINCKSIQLTETFSKNENLVF